MSLAMPAPAYALTCALTSRLTTARALVLVGTLLAGACGQKGALVLPSSAPTDAASAPLR